MGKWTGACAILLVVAFAGEARAQATPYELNLHVGAFRYDIEDSDTDAMLGARFLLQYPSGWGWGGNVDWVNVEEIEVPGEDVDFSLWLYSFEVDYTFPSAGRTKFFVGGGIGAATAKVSDVGDDDDDDSSTDPLLPLAAGIKFFNRPSQPTWAIRGDVRDNIIFVGDESIVSELRGDDTQNNLEISGGVSFFF